MGRPAKFSDDELLDAAVALVTELGPKGLTVAAVARRVGAPSGSVYHRFPSRDHLAASVWLRAAESFQSSWSAAVDFGAGDVLAVARASAAFTLAWCRENPGDAGVLLLYRSSEIMGDEWPDELVERNERQQAFVVDTMDAAAAQWGVSSPADVRRLRFAVLDVPLAAVRESLANNTPVPAELDAIVDDAVRGVLAGFT